MSSLGTIVYISKYASYPPYGMESRQIYLAREMVKKGYEVKLFTSTANHHHITQAHEHLHIYDGIEINWIRTRNYSKAYGVSRILSWFHFEWNLFKHLQKQKELNPAMVIVSSLSLLSILNGVQLKRKYRCTLVLEIRDIWPLILTEITSITKWNPLYIILSLVEKWGYKNADLIVGTMPNLVAHIQHRSSSKAPVIQIPHLLNDSIAFDNRHPYDEIIEEISKSDAPTVLVYSGNISKSAGLEFLLDGADELQLTGVSIILLGDGPMKTQLQEKYKNTNIYFLDKIAQNQVVAFLKDCDILYDGYLKSAIYEFGTSRNKYVEYCLAEKPLLVSYVGYKLFVEEYSCGIVVSPESTSAIVSGVKRMLSESSDKLTVYGTNALDYAKSNLQVKPQVDKLLDCINKL